MNTTAFALHPFSINQRQTPRRSTAFRCCTRASSPRVQVVSASYSRPDLPPIFFVLGGPGSGKGTQCALLQNEYNLSQICVGDLLRREAKSGTLVGQNVSEIMQRGEIVPGEITMSLLKQELSNMVGSYDGVLIDGFPRAMDQAIEFERLITVCEFVLFFHCEADVMVQRLLKRGVTSGRKDDNEIVVQKRLKTFNTKTMPVVEYYRQRDLLRQVNASEGTVEDVYQKTRSVFKHVLSHPVQ